MKNILLVALFLSGCAFTKKPVETVYLPFIEKAATDHMNDDFMLRLAFDVCPNVQSFSLRESRSASDAEIAFVSFDIADTEKKPCARAVAIVSCAVSEDENKNPLAKCFVIHVLSRPL